MLQRSAFLAQESGREEYRLDRQIGRYGAWESPISTDLLTQQTISVNDTAVDGEDVYWSEGRPYERGRSVIVCKRPGAEPEDVTPEGMNARTRVHEYGGGAFTAAEGVVYFVNFDDQRLYRQDRGGKPRAITAEGPVRYADMVYEPNRQVLYAVREDHRDGDREAVNTIVMLDPEGDEYGTVLVQGSDFCSNPRPSPDGERLTWLSWNHPNMPWDGTEVWLAEVAEDGSLENARRVAGGPAESVYQPSFAPDGTLHFVSDRTGYWNLYAFGHGAVRPLLPMDAEFGVPQWAFGTTTYGFLGDGRIVCRYQTDDAAHIGVLDPQSGQFTELQTQYSVVANPRVMGGAVLFLGASPTNAAELVLRDLATNETNVLCRMSRADIDPGYISIAQPITFPTAGCRMAYAYYYPPQNPRFEAPRGELPPLMVMTHGGPTGSVTSGLSLATQYWTSRGFAVVNVNYGGSAGYGREYRDRLKGAWGVVDVDDCTGAALYLAARGLVDPKRMAIRGGSAGGYTTLACLAFRDVFSAGASHFGVSDLEALATDTHKFESRYLDGLVGPLPDRRDIYTSRSPIHNVSGFNAPAIFFQGLEDRVVPPNQAQMMVDALRSKGVPVAHLEFEGEGHGFRRAENVRRSLEAELYFYGRVFGFTPAGEIEPVEISNL